MLPPTTLTRMENVWDTFQEPRCPAYLPNSYMLLLSALDQGWKVIKVELDTLLGSVRFYLPGHSQASISSTIPAVDSAL
jgi:hypothetical protein